MKTYAVTFFNNDNHVAKTDCFTAGSAFEARHDFRECYRHGNYTILSVIPLPEQDEQSSGRQEEKAEIAAEGSVFEEIDKTIIGIARRIQDGDTLGEYADTVKALAALVEARATLLDLRR